MISYSINNSAASKNESPDDTPEHRQIQRIVTLNDMTRARPLQLQMHQCHILTHTAQ